MDLRFESGRIAGARGWDSAVVVDSNRLTEEAPSSIPLLVEATRDTVTIDVARIISALHAAGRPVVLVTDSAPPADIAQWIPEECLHLIGTPVAARSMEPEADAESDGTDEFFGGYPPDIEGQLEGLGLELEADELLTLVGWLETTSIAIDTNREWWMKGYCLHRLTGGWDRAGHNDIMDHVGLVALPLRIGKSLVLGVGDIGGRRARKAATSSRVCGIGRIRTLGEATSTPTVGARSMLFRSGYCSGTGQIPKRRTPPIHYPNP